MSKESSSLSIDLQKRFKAFEASRAKIEALASKNLIPQQTVLHVYEGLFLNAHVAFEGFIEDLFIGLLVEGMGVTSSRTDIKPRITVRSHRIAREVVIGTGKSYVDWLPYEKTMKLADVYFRGGRPFKDLNVGQKNHLSKCHAIRNAIAHKSEYSMNRFERTVLQSTPLPSVEKKPNGYLRGLFRTTPAQTRYENLIAELLLIARELSK